MASPRLGVGPGAHMASGALRACVLGACHPPGHGRPLPTRPLGGFTVPTDSEPLAASDREGALLGSWRSGWSELGTQRDALYLRNSLQKRLFSFLLKDQNIKIFPENKCGACAFLVQNSPGSVFTSCVLGAFQGGGGRF